MLLESIFRLNLKGYIRAASVSTVVRPVLCQTDPQLSKVKNADCICHKSSLEDFVCVAESSPSRRVSLSKSILKPV